jgi:hypothetical protein
LHDSGYFTPDDTIGRTDRYGGSRLAGGLRDLSRVAGHSAPSTLVDNAAFGNREERRCRGTRPLADRRAQKRVPGATTPPSRSSTPAARAILVVTIIHPLGGIATRLAGELPPAADFRQRLRCHRGSGDDTRRGVESRGSACWLRALLSPLSRRVPSRDRGRRVQIRGVDVVSRQPASTANLGLGDKRGHEPA